HSRGRAAWSHARRSRVRGRQSASSSARRAEPARPGAAGSLVAQLLVERCCAPCGLLPGEALEDSGTTGARDPPGELLVVEAEALARFAGPPARGPDQWFAEAAVVGLARELELRAIERALGLLPALPEPLRLAVNAGPETFCSSELLDLLLVSTTGSSGRRA
ncbi:Diguanylate phosphodiesterase, predicted domain protein, partial [mine drainage metagenome]